jgi:adenylate cyclase
MAEVTVVFADLTGSTGVFESLGNAKATQAITRLTQWIGKVCQAYRGHVVKYLGDGVLVVFPDNADAVDAVTELQRVHRERIRNWPDQLKMRLQMGVARGEIVEQDGDCFGDAVNLASRLSDLSGPDQILATDTVIQHLPPTHLCAPEAWARWISAAALNPAWCTASSGRPKSCPSLSRCPPA